MKYNIGDKVYWVYSESRYSKKIPCPMCFGNRMVTIILGDDSQIKSECGYCGRGDNGPSGTATTWEPIAIVKSGVITGVTTRSGIRYEVGFESLEEHELFSSELEAKKVREVKYKKEVERSERWFRDNFKRAKESQIWSTGYHRNCIKDNKKSIEWHQLRLAMIKEKKK